jgi:YidC/Oxa1 family membrane protein insertase
MDRKAWIVITLCIVGMVINGWWMFTRPPAPQVSPPPPAGTTPGATPETPATGTTPAAAVTPATAPKPEEKVELKNEVATYTFTTKGGGIAEVVLLDTKDHVRLNAWGKAAIGSLTGAAKSYEDPLPYQIVEKTDQKIVFEAEGADKVRIRKSYAFSSGAGSNGHLLDFQITITNQGGEKLSKDAYFIYAGAANELRPDEISKPAFCWNDAGDADSKHTDAFRPGAGFLGFGGPILDYHGNFNRIRWAGVMSRFYATLIANKQDQPTRVWVEPFYVDHSNGEFKDHAKAKEDKGIHGGFTLPPLELEVGASKTHDMQIYLGPKIYHDLKKIDETEGREDRQLREVMFYGKWFGWVSRILAWALRFFHDITGNWGVAIILLTIAVRSLLWPLQARSNAQMKKMGKLSPMLKELQEKYKDDQQRFAQEQMKMFREYGVNPLGGCLPLLIQFPIFIAFYTVLQVATELRGQPFIGWVKDLSLPDTIASFNLGFNLWPIGTHIDLNPLPLLMGLTMFLQMKLTPQPATVDPMQRRIFMLMPFMFLAFCYTFASALALYWTFTNIFMIVQAQITRVLNKGADDAPLQKVNPGGGSGPGGLGGGASSSPMMPGQKKKKDRPHQPRLGGGGVKPTRPKDL